MNKSRNALIFKFLLMKASLTCLLIISVLLGTAPAKRIGVFQQSVAIGNPKMTGAARFDKRAKTYTLSGAGYNIWFARDEFQYLFRKMDGDFTVTADFAFVGPGTDLHRKVGWMVRESLDEDAVHVSAVSHGDGLTVLQWRVAKGAAMRDPQDEIFSPEKNVQTVQLERKGTTYTMRVAKQGADLQVVGSHEMSNLSGEVLVGPFICSHNADKVEEAVVSNVQIIRGK